MRFDALKITVKYKKSLTNHYVSGIIYIEKAKPQTVMPQSEFLDSPNLTGGGYLTFIVSVIRNTKTKITILSMYFFITITSFPTQSE